MSDAQQHPQQRPNQVTLAGLVVLVSAAGVVFAVFDQIRGLHSLATRAKAEQVLTELPRSTITFTVHDLLIFMQVMGMVAAACAAVCGVLAVYLLRRSRSARVVITVLAVVVLVTGMDSAGIFAFLLLAGVIVAWLRPARDWFTSASA